MCIHWFLFPPIYREVFNSDNSILPTRDVSRLIIPPLPKIKIKVTKDGCYSYKRE